MSITLDKGSSGNITFSDFTSCETLATDSSGNLVCEGIGDTATFTDTTSEDITGSAADLWDGTYPNITPSGTSNTVLVSVSAMVSNTTDTQFYVEFEIYRAIDTNPT